MYEQTAIPATEVVVEAMEKVAHHEGCTLHSLGAHEHSTAYWREVFVEVYGTEPQCNEDPRWPALFQQGMGYLHEDREKAS